LRISHHLSGFFHQRPAQALIGAFVLLVLLHGWATPLFEAPDEVWHYAYVRWLAEGHGLPAMDSDASGAGQEVAQPPLYYGVAALLSAPFPDDDLEDIFWHNPNFGYQAAGTIADNKNMLIHTDQEHIPWRGAVLSVHIVRLTSLLFGGITLATSWGLGYETFGTRRGALLTGALVAFQPQFVFISSVVSNDSAAAALSTVALWLTVRTLRRGLTHRRALLIGTVVGLAVLTKTSALLLIPFIGAALFWIAWRDHRPWGEIFAHLGLYVAAVLVLGSWWYIRNYALYGDPLGISSHVNTPWQHPEPMTLLELLPDLPLLIRSFWGAYGWGHVFWPDAIYAFLTIGALILGLRALHTILLDSRRPGSPRSALVLAMAWFALILAALLRWMQMVGAPHGRLLFPAIGAWAVMMAAGIQRCRWRNVGRGFLLSMAILTTLAPGVRLWCAFGPPRLLSPDQVWDKVSTVNFTYGDRIKLLGIDVSPTRPTPGDTMTVTACWEALRPLDNAYTVYVQLLGYENRRVGERHTYPGLGSYPTSLWEVGKAFCDRYRVSVASWAPTPEQYDLLIGFYDQTPNKALAAYNPDQVQISPPSVAEVAIVPENPGEIKPEHATQYQLGGHVELIGYERSPNIQSQQPFTVTLYWKAETTLGEDYKVFVHLRDNKGEVITQHDAKPRNGRYPTSIWHAGDIVPDPHALKIPEIDVEHDLQVIVGMYESESLERLPVIDDQGKRIVEDTIPLFNIDPE
jgi:hypothetical protein